MGILQQSAGGARLDNGMSAPEPVIVGFLCNWCACRAADMAGMARIRSAASLRPIQVMCSSRVDPRWSSRPSATGRRRPDCRLPPRLVPLRRRQPQSAQTPRAPVAASCAAGLEKERLQLVWANASEGSVLAAAIDRMTDQLRALGPLQWPGRLARREAPADDRSPPEAPTCLSRGSSSPAQPAFSAGSWCARCARSTASSRWGAARRRLPACRKGRHHLVPGRHRGFRAAARGVRAHPRLGGAELLLHLARTMTSPGGQPRVPAHQRSRDAQCLELAEPLKLRKFIFTSSIAACPFPEAGGVVTEQTEPSAAFPYARSKQLGEALMRVYRNRIPSCIVRPAAIFSDWCEYEPLDVFLQTWCSQRWNARVLGGRGCSRSLPARRGPALPAGPRRREERRARLDRSPAGLAGRMHVASRAVSPGHARVLRRAPHAVVRPGSPGASGHHAARAARAHHAPAAVRAILDGRFHRPATQRRRVRTRRLIDWAPDPASRS